MNSHLLIIAAILIALGVESTCLPAGRHGLNVARYLDPATICMLTIIAVCLAPVPWMLLSRWVHRTVNDGSLAGRGRAYKIRRILCTMFLLADFAAIIHLFGWAWFVDNSLDLSYLIQFQWLKYFPPLALALLMDELLKVLPFVIMLLMCWVPMYRIDLTIRRGHWSLADYVAFNLRQYVLFIMVPFSLVLLVENLWNIFPPTLRERLIDSGTVYALAAAAAALGLLCLPLLLRFVWKTRPLPDGQLRRRLEGLLTQTRLRCQEILLWDTFGGQMINACVTGFVKLTRYILITDTLVEALEPDEVIAVFAHEIGHVKRHHMFYYMMFAAGFLPVTALATLPGADNWGSGLVGELLGLAWLLTVPIVYWGVGFGYLSRRMEAEADLYACEVCAGVFDFVNALEKIARTSGKRRSAGSWRHFSIERRVNFLINTVGNPAATLTLRRQVRLLKGICVLVAAIATLTLVFFPDVLKGVVAS